LNLGLSCVAAVQGIILQIAANRGDRIASELALATHENSQELLTINEQQLQILNVLKKLQETVEDHSEPDVS
jgi:multidrug efflux pump subunit AcrA (membrane-fusion protein)